MSGRSIFGQLQPWLGMVMAAAGWAGSHQVASASIFDDCRAASPLFVLLTGLIGLALAIAGGLFSLIARRRQGESAGRHFIALTGILFAALASFAIVLQSVSALIIPPCAG
jgi:hypothetical protein